MPVSLLRQAGVKVAVRITVAWWVRWYLAGVELAAKLTGAEPDMDKVRATVMRGVKVRTDGLDG